MGMLIKETKEHQHEITKLKFKKSIGIKREIPEDNKAIERLDHLRLYFDIPCITM